MPPTVLRSFRWKSTLPITLSTETSLGKPLTTEVGLVGSGAGLVGNPVPLQAPVASQPAILRLTGLTSKGMALARKAACTSAIASGMLLTQSPAPTKEHV